MLTYRNLHLRAYLFWLFEMKMVFEARSYISYVSCKAIVLASCDKIAQIQIPMKRKMFISVDGLRGTSLYPLNAIILDH